MKRRATISIMCAYLALMQVFAQQLVLKTYDRTSGLPSNYVLNIYQDRDGFLWFSTDRGVSRYNGNSFVTYTTRDGLHDNFVQFTTQDRRGFVWFGLYDHGVARFDGKNFQSFTTADGLLSNTVNWIAEDRFGRRYFRSDNGITIYHRGMFTVTKKLGRAETIMPGADGSIFFADNKKLYRVIPSNDNELRYRLLTTLPVGPIIRVGLFEQASRAWGGASAFIGTYHELFIMKYLNDTTLVPLSRYQISGGVASIANEGDSVLWCGTLSDGISKITPSGAKRYGTGDGLLQQRVENLIRDFEGNIWFSSFGSGAQKLSAPSIVLYQQQDGLPNNYISSLYEDNKGRMWFGTSSGLAVLDGDTMIKLGSGEKDMREIRSVAQDHNGDYYIGTFEYIFGPLTYRQLLSQDRFKKIRIGYGVSGIYPVPDREINSKRMPSVWMGTFGGGITHLRGRDSSVHLSSDIVCSNVIEDVIITGNAAWFTSRNGGATRIVHEEMELFSTKNGLPTNSVFSIFEDSARKRIWIGTDAGLTLLEHGKSVTFSEQEGLLGQPVIGIFEQQQGSRTNDGGLFIVTPQALHRFKENKFEVIRSLSFAPQGILSVNDICYSAKSNAIWIATPQGAYKVPINTLHRTVVPPKVAIISAHVDTALIYNHATVYDTSKQTIIALPHTQNNLSIAYAGLSYTSESDVRFRIKLEPLDNDWSQPTKDVHVQYRNLNDGQYRFLVMAINGDGISSIMPAAFSFHILPPFWKQWWFLTIAGMSLFGAIVFITRHFARRQLRRHMEELERQKALQEERERISRDLHDNVGAQLVTIISGIELTERYAETKQREARNMLESLKEDARTTMALLRETIWALQASDMVIEKFARELEQYVRKQLKYKPGIALRFTFKGNRDVILRPVEAINILRIVQEALSNSLKHASPSIIEVSLHVEKKGLLLLELSNDGQLKEPADELSGGKGIPNMERRAGEIGGTFQFVQEGGKHTRIKLSVPLHNRQD